MPEIDWLGELPGLSIVSGSYSPAVHPPKAKNRKRTEI